MNRDRDTQTERRQTARIQPTTADAVSVRIRPGLAASIVDVSVSGVLIETSRRLFPGTTVELQIEASNQRTAIRGRVLRCAVTSVAASVVAYRGAIAFDRHLPWFVRPGTVPGDVEQRPALPAREAASQSAGVL